MGLGYILPYYVILLVVQIKYNLFDMIEMINGGHLLGGGSHQIRKLIQLVVVIAIFSDDWCTWYTLRI